MKIHVLSGDERMVLVTGATDPGLSDPAVIQAIVDEGWFEARVENAWPDITPERARELERIEAREWLAQNPARLTSGRIVPDASGDYAWLWHEDRRAKGPGAFFALVYEAPRRSTRMLSRAEDFDIGDYSDEPRGSQHG